ncbi:MAG TPA: hypothetical protein VGX69_06975 [Solirubrobacteraceae bacterium]|jgi:DNA-directed RNA polymerase specialized sigma24 family protein|nr:hypothetical protein [Solirubrobacteraceae bacterium]
MSPLTLRRYRADRLLRAEFERLRATVLGGVAARLRAVGVRLDASDLDACYAQAWQGLYAAVLDGARIASPEAWLARVTYRRAIDEHRARVCRKRLVPGRVRRAPAVGDARRATDAALAGIGAVEERDLADRLDDHVRLRHLFEALRSRLSAREQQAATLCYLQGLSRADAAVRMGVSERRMHKLMDGRGDGRPGVAQKVGALLETIDAGRWCEEQGSLMRGLAYGILDPAGERHGLAEAHYSKCPACRAYVLSLRGLAAVLPPVPSLLHLLLGSGAAAGGGAAAAASSATGGSGLTGAGGGAGSTAGAGASVASTAGALSASGAAGGGWWLAGGSLGAKLAVGCVFALGLGAGCVALEDERGDLRPPVKARHARTAAVVRRGAAAMPTGEQAVAASASALAVTPSAAPAPARLAAVPPPARAAREFGPEQLVAGSRSTSSRSRSAAVARAASVTAAAGGSAASASGGPADSGAGGGSRAAAPADAVPAAQREFAPG